MLEQLQIKYNQLQDENINLMFGHLAINKRQPYSKEILINFVLLTKLGQMIRQTKSRI